MKHVAARMLLASLALASAVLLAAPPAAAITKDGDLTSCFVPGDDCAAFVASAVDGAERELLVMAYNFTEPRIIEAIVRAKQRGVAVTVILDKISPCQKGEGADPVSDAGIPVFVDRKVAIAHNKVLIIDGRSVLMGSFNFSSHAAKNAENTNLLVDRPAVAAAYAAQFARRKAVSAPYARGAFCRAHTAAGAEGATD